MGQYLKQQYEEREIAKALAKVHGLIDEETKKLSDKVKELKLSHNRMRNLLKMTLKLLESSYFEDKYKDLTGMYSVIPSFFNDAFYLHKRISLELYGLENYKGLKGGKKCG